MFYPGGPVLGFHPFFTLQEIPSESPVKQKPSGRDAHSRERKMLPSATALGASVPQAERFVY
jgi:hypothetical protein